MEFVKKYHVFPILVIFVFCLGIFLRFYKIESIPNGLYPDETALGYNAYSILVSGKDEYGVSYPLYFKSFDDYKLPVYIYSTAFAIKAFGATPFAVRVTSALFGSLAIIALYFLINELSKKKWLALTSAAFLALNPWHSFFSRAGYEVNAATALILIGTLFFIMAINRKNNFFLFLLSIISFLLSVYTYNVTRLIAPLIFLTLLIFYFKKQKKLSSKLLPILLLLFGIGMIPFFISFAQLQSQSGFSSQSDALLIGNAIRAEIMETRSYFVVLPKIIQQIFFNYYFLVGFYYIKNLVSFFSTSFFFIIGADHPNENIGRGLGMFYYFDFPLMILGAYEGIKRKEKFIFPFFIWFLIIFVVGSIIKSVPNGTRTYAIVIPLVVFSSYGFYVFCELIIKLKNIFLKRIIFLISFLFIFYSVSYYFLSYFIRFPVEYARDWRSEDAETVSYLDSIKNNYNSIIFDDRAEFFYTSLLFYSKFDPQYYQQNAQYVQSGLVTTLKKVGKIEFRKVDWKKDLATPGTLIITGKQNIPENKKPLKIFSYPTRPIVQYFDRQIGRWPTTDIAYEIFSSE